VVKENNELHMQLIRLKEDAESKDSHFKSQLRQLQSEKEDVAFLAEQKDAKIRELDKAVLELKQKLDRAINKAYIPSASEVKKGEAKPQSFDISHEVESS